VLILLFALIISHPGFARQSPQATFDKANTLFKNGDISEALHQYRTIEAAGQESGALYLNMGIAAVQLDSLGLAKYYFLKALRFDATNNQAQEALKYVNSQFSRQSAMLPKLPWDRAIHWANEVPGAGGVFITGFFITLIGLIILYLGWFNKLELKRFFPYIITLIIVGSAISLAAFYADYVNGRYDEAVLIASQQRVLQSPGTESTLVSIAYEGYDLVIDQRKSESRDNWLYIRLGNGQYGWIQSQGVKVL
jgi:tetratricopeptide (TPR) repeat protein